MRKFQSIIRIGVLSAFVSGVFYPSVNALSENLESGSGIVVKTVETIEAPEAGVLENIQNFFTDSPDVKSKNFGKKNKNGKNVRKKNKRVKLKTESDKFKKLTEKKQKKLLKKLERLEKKELSKKSKKLKKELEKQKKAFDRLGRISEKQDETANKKTQKEFKKQLKERYKLLKKLNDQQKTDFDAEIKSEFSGEEQGLLEAIEPDYLMELQGFVPNDSRYTEQWSLNFIGAEGFAPTEVNHDKPIIAVIDTGFDLDHPELTDSWWGRSECFDADGIVIPGGCPVGYDVVDEDTNPEDEQFSHGTATAGLIGALTNNGAGIASLANNQAEIMPIRACSDDGYFRISDVVEAIHFAVNNGADIINMSLGGPAFSTTIYDAIAYAEENGVVVTIAAGNYGGDNDVSPIYPASYDLDNIISVGAHDDEGYLASFSNYGATTVDLLAPGVNVLTTTVNGNTRTYNGTSFSAPLTAASLVRYMVGGKNPEAAARKLLQEVNGYVSLENFVDGGKRLEFGERDIEVVEIDPIISPEVEVTDKALMLDDFLKVGISPIRDSEEIIKEIFTDPELQKRALLFKGRDEYRADKYDGFMKIALVELLTGGFFTDKNVSYEDMQKVVDEKWNDSESYKKITGFRATDREKYSTAVDYGILQQLRGMAPLGEDGWFPLQFDFEYPTYYSGDLALNDNVHRFLAHHASSRAEYERWISLGEGSLYETYEKLFGWPNHFFEQNGMRKLGQRTLLQKAPAPMKAQEVQSENLTYVEILNLSQELFPEAPEGVVRFFYREEGLSGFSAGRLYKISRYTGFLEPEIEKNLKYNILSSIALMERRKKMMFGDEDVSHEQWGEVLVKEMENVYVDKSSDYCAFLQELLCSEFKRSEDQKENLKIFLSYLNGTALSEVVLPSALEEEVEDLFFYSDGGTSYELSSISGLPGAPTIETQTINTKRVVDANRASSAIDTIVIHTMGVPSHPDGGMYESVVQSFTDDEKITGVHFLIDSSNGEITQMADVEDITYHAGRLAVNNKSIGIEHEGMPNDPTSVAHYYTPEMYESSAALVRFLTQKYDIKRISHEELDPFDGPGIIEHLQVSGCTNITGEFIYAGGGGNYDGKGCHTDVSGYVSPTGPYLNHWKWEDYMALIKPTHLEVKIGGKTIKDEGVETVGYFTSNESSSAGIIPVELKNVSTNETITVRALSSGLLSKMAPDRSQFVLSNKAQITLDPGDIISGTLYLDTIELGINQTQLDLTYTVPGEEVPYYHRSTLKAAVGEFNDILDTDWYARYVKFLLGEGVIPDYGIGNYRPAEFINRLDVLIMAYNGKGIDVSNVGDLPGFDDTTDPYVRHAKDAGHVKGVPCSYDKSKTCFLPNQPVSRFEAAKILHAVFEYEDLEDKKYPENGIPCSKDTGFSDVKIDQWYCGAVKWMKESKAEWDDESDEPVAGGYPSGCFAKADCTQGEFNNINRAEMAKVVANAMRFKNIGSTILPHSMTMQSNPEMITLGNLYEQPISSQENNAPQISDVVWTVKEGDTREFTAPYFPKTDSDGDELFYFWGATGGQFITDDHVNYASVKWIAPEVDVTTTYKVYVTAGDGKGKIDTAVVTLFVQDESEGGASSGGGSSDSYASTTTGGLWTSPSTWIGGVVPYYDAEEVIIKGAVTLNQSSRVGNLYITKEASLTNKGTVFLTLTQGGVENEGTIETNTTDGENLYIEFLNSNGKIENYGEWNPYETKIEGDVEIVKSTTLGGRFSFDPSHELTVNTPHVLILSGVISHAEIEGTGTTKFTGGLASGEFHIANLILSGNNVQSVGSPRIYGNLELGEGVTLGSQYGSTLIVDGDLLNNGIIQGKDFDITIGGKVTNSSSGTIRAEIPEAEQYSIPPQMAKELEAFIDPETIGLLVESPMDIFVSGDLVNNGRWEPDKTIFEQSSTVLNSAVLGGKVKTTNGIVLTVNAPYQVTFKDDQELGLDIAGTGSSRFEGDVKNVSASTDKMVFGGDSNQDISGTNLSPNADFVRFEGDGVKSLLNALTVSWGNTVVNGGTLELSSPAFTTSGDFEVRNDGVVQNRVNQNVTLNVGGDLTYSDGIIRNNPSGGSLAFVAALSCDPGDSLLWNVLASCTLDSSNSSVEALGDVFVAKTAVLTIPEDKTFLMNLTDHNLTVETGGGVLIKQGGAIKQTP